VPERDSHPDLYAALQAILDFLDDPLVAGGLIVRFELKLLDDLGFGLDLERCAVTGASDDLIYVSPRSGRAVSRAAGVSYKDRLLALPDFLLASATIAPHSPEELADAFRLTGYFLARHVYEPRGIEPSDARASLLSLIARQATAA
jgi:DNA repair protein RecO (recombination protein O)